MTREQQTLVSSKEKRSKAEKREVNFKKKHITNVYNKNNKVIILKCLSGGKKKESGDK